VIEADDRHLRIETKHRDGFRDQFVDTDCSALTLKWTGGMGVEPIPKDARAHHLKIETLALFDAPDGRLVRALDSRNIGWPTLWVTETSGSYRKFVIEDALRITGWARAIDLEEGSGDDGYDHGVLDVDDWCYGHPIADDDEVCEPHGEKYVRVK